MRRVGVATLAAAACLAAILPVTTAARGPSRPFKASIHAFANPDFPMPPEDPCVVSNTEHGTLQATHLGRSTWESTESVNVCSNPEGADVVGQFTIVSASGDRLFGSYETLAHFDFPNDEITFSGQYTIAGGTGRFHGASGGGSIEGSGTLSAPFDVFGRMTGRLTY